VRLPLPVARALVFLISRPIGPPLPVRFQRLWLEAMSTGGILPPGTTVERVRLGGCPAERIVPAGADSRRAVLLLHGGAFVIGSPRTHRVLAAHLAAAVGAPVSVLHYRRAPEHPWPAAVDDAHAAYRELSARVPTAVFGDSAGGALGLMLALRLRDDGAALPPALALVSPATDLTLRTSAAYRGRDPVVRRTWLRQGVTSFVGDADPVALSPLAADLRGLPPVLLQVAAGERLEAEGLRLAERLRAADVAVELDVLPRVWHDVHLLAHLLPEAADPLDRIGRRLAEALAASPA